VLSYGRFINYNSAHILLHNLSITVHTLVIIGSLGDDTVLAQWQTDFLVKPQ